MKTATYRGKIARLPHLIREQLNTRLRDGQLSPDILPWLNSIPAVLQLLKSHWHGAPIRNQNLSKWRLGGYQHWLAHQEENELVGELCEYARKLTAESGGTPADAAAAIAGGRLLAAIEQNLTPEAIRDLLTEKPASLLDLISKITALQSEARKKLKVETDVAKFQRDTTEMVAKFHADARVQKILDGKDAHPVKMDKLVKLMFGEKPTLAPIHA